MTDTELIELLTEDNTLIPAAHEIFDGSPSPGSAAVSAFISSFSEKAATGVMVGNAASRMLVRHGARGAARLFMFFALCVAIFVVPVAVTGAAFALEGWANR